MKITGIGVDSMTKRYVKSSSENGWNEENLYDVLTVTDKIYDLSYEIQHCIRGVYTCTVTYENLAEYIIKLGEELQEVGEDLLYNYASEYDL